MAANVAASLDKTKFTQADMDELDAYAVATCDGYCAGCSEICDSVVPEVACVSNVMRYLMYHNSYRESANAKELFAKIPADVRARIATAEYSVAEARCPQKMPIATLMAEAAKKLV